MFELRNLRYKRIIGSREGTFWIERDKLTTWGKTLLYVYSWHVVACTNIFILACNLLYGFTKWVLKISQRLLIGNNMILDLVCRRQNDKTGGREEEETHTCFCLKLVFFLIMSCLIIILISSTQLKIVVGSVQFSDIPNSPFKKWALIVLMQTHASPGLRSFLSR